VRRSLFSAAAAKGSATTPLKILQFLCYLALTVVVPAVGIILGGMSIAKGCGKRKTQGLILFVIANVSIFAYVALFTIIIAQLR
jgi:hypothetical protein